MVALGQINKLDIRGGQLAARENLIFLLNEGIPFSNIKDAAVKLGIPYSTISLAFRTGKICKNKYYFRNSPIDSTND